ncbi:MAG: thioredoxin [Rikenellaceae bacterium]|jgi:thioredoxin 1|nr:thioredoxin [Rikenellaceae bacterium]
MQVANNKNFNDILASSRLVLVDFWASWCGPCRMLSPIVDDIAKEFEGKIEVAKCNIDDAEEVAAKYGIRSIPTLLFFKDGEVADKTVGFVNKAEIEKRINNLL